MSDLSVSERRIRPIQDAIGSANWKQALQLCDKWSKKGERSDKFLAVKAFVLVNQTDKTQHDRGQQEALDLCKRTPPVTEPEAIYHLQLALKSLSLHEEESSKLWERAVSAKKDDKDLYMRWLNQAIVDNNWRSAQKATMGLRNSFPQERHYEFWNIAMCYLIHKQEDLPEKERMLFGTLAYRMISKGAEAIPKDEEQASSSAKAISDPEEVALLVQVFNSTGHVQEAVKLLQGGSLSMKSRLGKKDPQLILSLLLESLEKSEQWDEAVKICQELLSNADYQSDDRIWTLWLKAHSKSSDIGLEAESKKLLETVCSIRPMVRSAHLAKLSLQRTQGNQVDQDDLLHTCKDYYETFSEKGFCFDDLKESLQRLDKSHLEVFMQLPTKGQGNSARLFSLKILYGSLSPGASKEELMDFAYKALQLYQNSLMEHPSFPEAALLAVLAILRVPAPLSKEYHQVILFAVIILQIARSKFEDYYILTILLVQLQAHLGLLSLAMENFMKLSVKNLQWETVGHLILSRISSLHPAYRGAVDDLEPLLALETGLTVLEKADNALVQGIREGLRFNSHSNIYNSVNMRSDIEQSMNKQIYAIEERKVSRWRGKEFDDFTVLPLMDASKVLVDKRDFSYMPSYREDDRALLTRFRCGPLPKEGWIHAMALLDNVANYFNAEFALQPSLATKAYENIKHLQARSPVETTDIIAFEGEMTDSEIAEFQCNQILTQAIIVCKEGATSISQDQNPLPDLLAELKSSLTSKLDNRRRDSSTPSPAIVAGIHVATWVELHVSLTQLESLQVTANFLTWLSKKQSKSSGKASKTTSGPAWKETISELQTLVTELDAQIHADARALKSQLNEPGVLGKLVDLGMARQIEANDVDSADWMWTGLENGAQWEQLIESICDETIMETICGRMRESWDDALDGVLMTKVRIVK